MFRKSLSFALLSLLLLSVIGIAAAQDEPVGERPLLGIQFAAHQDGVLVEAILFGSPASEVGLREGDVVKAINGEAVTAENIIEFLQQYEPDDLVTLTVLRSNVETDVRVLLGIWASLDTFVVPSVSPRVGISLKAMDYGLEVSEVVPNSAADRAGLEVGDVVTAINDVEVTETFEAQSVIRRYLIGDTLTFDVMRNGAALSIDVPLEGLSVPFDFDMGELDGIDIVPNRLFQLEGDRIFLGVRYVTLNEVNAERYEAPVSEGALVVDVMTETPAEEAGLLVDDVILAVDGDLVDFERNLRDRLYAYEPGDTVTFEVLRDGETLEIEVLLISILDGAREIQSD